MPAYGLRVSRLELLMDDSSAGQCVCQQLSAMNTHTAGCKQQHDNERTE